MSQMICTSHMPDGTENPKWHANRRKGVTATDTAKLLTGGSWMDLWARKTGRVEREDLAAKSERVYWGHLMEPVVLRAYSTERYAHRPVEPLGWLIRSDEYPFMLATLDARTKHPDVGWIPLDAKNTDKFLEDRWSDGPPPYIAWQIKHQAITDDDTGLASVAVAVGGNRLLWTDEQVLDADRNRILRVAEEFWWHVENDVPPKHVDPLPETKRALYATYIPDGGSTIELGPSFTELDNEYIKLTSNLATAKEGLKAVENRIEEIKTEMMMAMGDRSIAVLEGDVIWTLKRVTREPFTVNPKPYNKLTRRAPKQ